MTVYMSCSISVCCIPCEENFQMENNLTWLGFAAKLLTSPRPKPRLAPVMRTTVEAMLYGENVLGSER
jgi:hypothetical protein